MQAVLSIKGGYYLLLNWSKGSDLFWSSKPMYSTYEIPPFCSIPRREDLLCKTEDFFDPTSSWGKIPFLIRDFRQEGLPTTILLLFLNPNWHEGWYFYLLVIFRSDFVSKLSKLFEGENWHQSSYFDTQPSLLSLLKVVPRWR